MKILTFPGGAHVRGHKEATRGVPIREFLSPPAGTIFAYPMSQHIGKPCEPVVAVGDRVLLGQKIADSTAAVSAPIYSGASGTVREIAKRLTPGGGFADSVIIESDGACEEAGGIGSGESYESLPRERLLEIIREAGVVGLGGAGFPTHIKLNPPTDKRIDTIICNAAECEPYLTTDHRIMLEEAEALKRGLLIVLSMFPGARGYIAIETNKPDAIKKMTELCAGEPTVEVVGLKPKYPQGAEKQLIYAVTRREVPLGGLPADVGCIVDNVDTLVAIERAVHRGRPLTRRIITLTGGAVANPGNYKVRIGMSFRDLIEMSGGFKAPARKLIMGGPMMGAAVYDTDIPVTKTSSALICMTEEECLIPEERSCIRCGRCVSGCPINLMPLDLNRCSISGDISGFVRLSGSACIECGSCSYVCPAKRHLAQSIRTAKKQAAETGR